MGQAPQSSPASTRERRLRAVVERFAPAAEGTTTTREVAYLQQLQVAATGRPIQAGEAWVERDELWQSAGVQPGDTVIFTTQLQALVREAKDLDATGVQNGRPRWITTALIAPGTRDVVVVRRPVAARPQAPVVQPASLPVAQPAQRPQRSKPGVAMAVALLLLGTLGGGAFGWWAGTRQAPAPSTHQAP